MRVDVCIFVPVQLTIAIHLIRYKIQFEPIILFLFAVRSYRENVLVSLRFLHVESH